MEIVRAQRLSYYRSVCRLKVWACTCAKLEYKASPDQLCIHYSVHLVELSRGNFRFCRCAVDTVPLSFHWSRTMGAGHHMLASTSACSSGGSWEDDLLWQGVVLGIPQYLPQTKLLSRAAVSPTVLTLFIFPHPSSGSQSEVLKEGCSWRESFLLF